MSAPDHSGGFQLELYREGEQRNEALAAWLSIASSDTSVHVRTDTPSTYKEKPKR